MFCYSSVSAYATYTLVHDRWIARCDNSARLRFLLNHLYPSYELKADDEIHKERFKLDAEE